ncbi:MAG: hypothetical protein ACPL4H_01085, partial [Anaerolineales bacterium]
GRCGAPTLSLQAHLGEAHSQAAVELPLFLCESFFGEANFQLLRNSSYPFESHSSPKQSPFKLNFKTIGGK